MSDSDLGVDNKTSAMVCDVINGQNKANKQLEADDDITILSSDDEASSSNKVDTEIIDILSDDDCDYKSNCSQSNFCFKTNVKGDEECEFLDQFEENINDQTKYVDMNNCGAHSDDTFNVKDEEERVLVNVDHSENEKPIYLPPHLADVIKPHQIGGIRFLYDNIIESLTKYDQSLGLGCILAHSMGLGKTLQIISFIDIFLTHTKAKHVLCIVPINTLQNWMNEFDIWLPNKGILNFSNPDSKIKHRDFAVYMLNDCKTTTSRAKEILSWRKNGGVLLIGYEMYRILTTVGFSKRKTNETDGLSVQACENLLSEIKQALVNPGPDLVICDEGHRIKNCNAVTSQALKNIKTRRRVVLTGYPLQNNLMEYWCMVDFVRPNFLGSKQEFSNMFEKPIALGQCADSTPADRKLMRYRAHVLSTLLRSFVQRRSHSILTKCLPKKHEHVILARMTSIQKDLMLGLLSNLKKESTISFQENRINPILLFSFCCKIWNHPDILYKIIKEGKSIDDLDIELPGSNKSRSNGKKAKKSNDNFLQSENFFFPSSSDSTTASASALAATVANSSRSLDYSWAIQYFDNYKPGRIENGMKMILLFEIIEKTLAVNDKLLIFSQSLFTLDLIEQFLNERFVPLLGEPKEKWSRWLNYYRVDGSTSSAEREKLIKQFNKDKNIFLFLLSTRAGCLGINLIGANRIVIFDASWNPCHDAQAACRVYRYGQTKESYVYRLICDNSLEKKIYDRQISKQEMSHRVVDELNPETNFTWKEINSLISNLDEINEPPVKIFVEEEISEYQDDVIRYLCKSFSHCMTKEPFEHESLLLDRKETKLSQKEKQFAEQSYLILKQQKTNISFPSYSNARGSYGQSFSLLRPTYPNLYHKNNVHPGFNFNPSQHWNNYSSTINFQSSLFAKNSFILNSNIQNLISDKLSFSACAQQLSQLGHTVKQVINPQDIHIPQETSNQSEHIFIPKGQKILIIKTLSNEFYIRTLEGKLILLKSNPFQLSALFSQQSSINSTNTNFFNSLMMTIDNTETFFPNNPSLSSTSVSNPKSPIIIFLSDDEDDIVDKIDNNDNGHSNHNNDNKNGINDNEVNDDDDNVDIEEDM